jgi:hypothetical protein
MTGERLAFSSKIDLWLLILLLAAVAGCLAVTVELWAQISGPLWWVGLLLLPGILLPLWLLLSTRYSMSDSDLDIRCGPFHWNVPIADITAITPSGTWEASPALSLDRLRIDYGAGQSVIISPEHRDAFVKQLEYRRRQSAGT